MAMSVGWKVRYWEPMLLNIEGCLFVPFIDPRKSSGLNRESRRFVFSMMHERIRAANPDYESVRFVIIQFEDKGEDVRCPVLHKDEGIEWFSRNMMEAMVETTYNLWREVCGERAVEKRRRAGEIKRFLI